VVDLWPLSEIKVSWIETWSSNSEAPLRQERRGNKLDDAIWTDQLSWMFSRGGGEE